MATREDLYKNFGPILAEAIVLIIKEEINILRKKAGLPERNNDQIIQAINEKLNSLPVYNWMIRGIG